MDKDFWKGRKVLITGHTGFCGSWLTLILNKFKAKVIGVSLEPKIPSLYSSIGVDNYCTSFIKDINKLDEVTEIFKSEKPDLVFHLAAQPLVRASYQDPINTFMVNAIGTANILEAVRQTKSVKSAVFITTDKCYENKEWVWGYRETDPLGGHDPYSASKACAELIVNSYRKSFFYTKNSPSVSSVRAGNVIGGGDFAEDRLIPDLFRAIKDGKSILLRNPTATRPWQHVFEPLRGYMMVAERSEDNKSEEEYSWNFGPLINDIRTVDEISKVFCQSWGVKNILKLDKNESPHEAISLSLDISQAYHKLGWLPKWDLDQSIDLIVEWYKTYLEGGDLKSKSFEHIERYFS